MLLSMMAMMMMMIRDNVVELYSNLEMLESKVVLMAMALMMIRDNDVELYSSI